MAKNPEEFQQLGQQNFNTALKLFGKWNKGVQTIADDMTDYTKRSIEDAAATFEKLLSAKSVEQAVEIQSGYAKRVADGYVHQLSKISSHCAELVRETYKRAGSERA